MFDYLPGTERLVRGIWDKNVARHPGDERWVNWGIEYIGNHLQGLAQTFIVTCDGEPVGEGTLLFSPQCSAVRGRTELADGKTNTNLNALRIEKKYEGQGHISKLVKLMEKTAKEMGYEYITIGVGEDRTRNRAIYTHWGYTDLIYVHMEGDEPVLYYRKKTVIMKNKPIIKSILLILATILLLTACSNNVPDSAISSEPVVNSTSEVILPQYTAKLMDESKPYVLSNLPLSMDDPLIGTVDNTLSFPVYHDKYGSYFMGKRGGHLYTDDEKHILYIGLEMEDGAVRYFNDSIYHNGYDNLQLWEGYTFQTQPWEKFYFFGAMTEEKEMDTITYLMTMIDCWHPERGPDLEYYDSSWGIRESEDNLLCHNEDDMLGYLLTTEKYIGCEKVLSYFGRKCIYNPYEDTYTFADVKLDSKTVGFKEISGWTGHKDYTLNHNSVCIDRFSLTIE